MLLLSLRSTSVHIVSSDSSFDDSRSSRICAASSTALLPGAIVLEIGHVSTRRPSTRTYISGDAPTRNASCPRLMNKAYGAGLVWRSVRKIAEGWAAQGSTNVWLRTSSNRSPFLNASLAFATEAAYSPGAWSHALTVCDAGT